MESSSSSSSLTLLNPCSSFLHHRSAKSSLQIQLTPKYTNLYLRPQFARRIVSTYPQEGDNLVNPSPQNWVRGDHFIVDEDVDEEDDDDDDDDEEDEDRSLDLFVRFFENVFKKISRKARKAVRSVLPRNVSAKLVRFSVNGSLILTFLWVLKAFLEVVCTLGSVVFVSILVIRGVWTGLSHLQENRYYRRDGIDDLTWSGTRPA